MEDNELYLCDGIGVQFRNGRTAIYKNYSEFLSPLFGKVASKSDYRDDWTHKLSSDFDIMLTGHIDWKSLGAKDKDGFSKFEFYEVTWRRHAYVGVNTPCDDGEERRAMGQYMVNLTLAINDLTKKIEELTELSEENNDYLNLMQKNIIRIHNHFGLNLPESMKTKAMAKRKEPSTPVQRIGDR